MVCGCFIGDGRIYGAVGKTCGDDVIYRYPANTANNADIIYSPCDRNETSVVVVDDFPKGK